LGGKKGMDNPYWGRVCREGRDENEEIDNVMLIIPIRPSDSRNGSPSGSASNVSINENGRPSLGKYKAHLWWQADLKVLDGLCGA